MREGALPKWAENPVAAAKGLAPGALPRSCGSHNDLDGYVTVCDSGDHHTINAVY